MPVFSHRTLLDATTRTFEACGVPRAAAFAVAEHLVEAELCGVISHGLIRVPQYVRLVDEGKIAPAAELEVVSERAATAVLDGKHGFGQVMVNGAVDIALGKARAGGVGASTLVNCGHSGRLGSYTSRIARAGMVGMVMANAGGHGQWVAPFGGRDRRLGTNPISYAVPGADGEAVLLDIATSVAPEGKIRAMMRSGREVPEGWVADSDGRTTTDPSALYGPPLGTLLPLGAHKGYGLSVIVDLLAGGLSGAGVCSKSDAPADPDTNGVFVLAVDVEAFCGRDRLDELVSAQIAHLKSSAVAEGFDEVLFPGELEARSRRECLASGVSIDSGVWKEIVETFDRFGVTVEEC
jgi:uncharacterized oxidoreductase